MICIDEYILKLYSGNTAKAKAEKHGTGRKKFVAAVASPSVQIQKLTSVNM